ncbi:ESPR-type extended signal peptide-containing protein [Megasphaera elsdenii]|uniref:ESPR-type extended signal peptide-containing protein n=1 Tax=Megasphaera elsdenii TaxID=907 RepID=UPI00351FD06F
MNKIFKVIYSKTRHCYVVVSELAKSHCKTTQSHTVRSKAALTAAVLLALGAFSFVGMPVAQAADGTESLKNNDYVGANGYYWYFDEKTNQWTKYPYKLSNINNNRSWQELPNYKGGGAKEPGAVTAGLYAQAGEQTITIGNRNAGQSKGSVFIGELDRYNDGGKNDPVGMRNNYVTAVGFQSNATGWGSIAIGSNAVAENTQETSQVVDYEGSAGTSGTVQDDNYGIKLKPSIKWSSVALGYSAQAKDGNIAIGAYSDATDTSSATPYVSVGSSTLKRRITNVADGTGDTDVATVGQMNKAIESIGTTGWNLSTNGYSSSTTITSGKTVDFSPAVDGKNGTTDHKNVKISNDGSNVKIGLNKDIVLGEATEGEGGSLNVYSDSTEASNLGNRVSIDGSTVSVNYGKEDGTSGTKRGVVLGVGEDYNNNAQGYIAFNNIDAKGTIGSTYLHSATDAPNDLKGRLVYSNAIDGTEYIANLDDGITFTGDVQKDVPKDYTQTPTKLNTTLNITGGAATEKDLTEGNIGVVSTPAAESADGTTQASKLEIKLNKDLKGITSISNQTTTDGTTTVSVK